MKKLLAGSAAILALGVSASWGADEGAKPTVLQLAAWEPVQLAPASWNVYGLRLDIFYGKNLNVAGLDAGLGLNSAGNTYGVAVGGANLNEGNVYGIQAAGMNFNDKDDSTVAGIQGALALNYAPDTTVYGVQAAVWNEARSFMGVQAGAVNICRPVCGDIYGIQLGGFFNADLRCSTFAGLQLATVANIAGGADFYGIQGALYNQTKDAAGLQLGVINQTKNVYGVELGALLNRTASVAGIQAGTANCTAGDVRGIQIGALFNYDSQLGDIAGIQVASIANHTPSSNLVGLQSSALWNDARDVAGAQIGLINLSDSHKGLQIGLVNLTGKASGFQIGLINKAERMTGVQIGLLNVISSSDLMVLPILNVQF